MTALNTLGLLSTRFTWNAFPTVLKEFPHMLSTYWLLFLHSAVQLIPNHLNWVEVGWLRRRGHLMLHSITLLLGQIAFTQPGGVLGHCPVKKKMIVPLSANQMGWSIASQLRTNSYLQWRPTPAKPRQCWANCAPPFGTPNHSLMWCSRGINLSSAAEVNLGLPFLWWSPWEPDSSYCLMVFATALEETLKVFEMF